FGRRVGDTEEIHDKLRRTDLCLLRGAEEAKLGARQIPEARTRKSYVETASDRRRLQLVFPPLGEWIHACHSRHPIDARVGDDADDDDRFGFVATAQNAPGERNTR